MFTPGLPGSPKILHVLPHGSFRVLSEFFHSKSLDVFGSELHQPLRCKSQRRNARNGTKTTFSGDHATAPTSCFRPGSLWCSTSWIPESGKSQRMGDICSSCSLNVPFSYHFRIIFGGISSGAIICRAMPCRASHCVEVVLQAAYEATLTIASCLAAKKGTRIKVWKKYEEITSMLTMLTQM